MQIENKQEDRYYLLIAKICGAIEDGYTGGYVEQIFKTNTEKTSNHSLTDNRCYTKED